MKITLKKLNLKNFKGIKDFSIEFGETTNVYGANESGKTTLFDAFTWILFGKDSTDRKDFEIKTIKEDGEPVHQVEHSVEAVIDNDGQEVILKKIYKEKWTTRRGSSEPEFTGHETLHYYQEVPLSQKDYQQKISNMIDESMFKILTNPFEFNKINWKDRRSLLFDMSPTIDDIDVANKDIRFKSLLNELKTKSIDEFKKEMSHKKKKIKNDLDSIPHRIDEVNMSIPTIEIDRKKLTEERNKLEKDISHIHGQIKSITEAYREKNKQHEESLQKSYELRSKLSDIEFNAKRAVSNAQRKDEQYIKDRKDEQQSIEKELKSIADKIKRAEQNKETTLIDVGKLRQEWHSVNADEFVFDPSSAVCPTCKQHLNNEDEIRDKLEANFNKDKIERLSRIEKRGKELNIKVVGYVDELTSLEEEQDNLRGKHLEIEGDIIEAENHPIDADDVYNNYLIENRHKDIKSELDKIEAKAQDSETPPDTAELELQRGNIESQINDIDSELDKHDRAESAERRIYQLKQEQKDLAQKISDLDHKDALIRDYNKIKIEAIEGGINSMFSYVRFKMYQPLINGGEEEVCICTVDGVPFDDLNTASKINAGLDIINTISDHRDIYAPIWLDNRESVTDIIETKSQIINLFVSPENKKLEVDHG